MHLIAKETKKKNEKKKKINHQLITAKKIVIHSTNLFND